MICSKCQRHLPDYYAINIGQPMPDDAWRMKNIAPDAASGGVILAVCYRCEPEWIPVPVRVGRMPNP